MVLTLGTKGWSQTQGAEPKGPALGSVGKAVWWLVRWCGGTACWLWPLAMSAVGFPTVLSLQVANTTLLLTFGFKYFSIRCCPHSFLFSSGATSYPAWGEQTVGGAGPARNPALLLGNSCNTLCPKFPMLSLKTRSPANISLSKDPALSGLRLPGFSCRKTPYAQKFLLEHPASQFVPRVSGTSLSSPVKPEGLCSYHSIQELDAAGELGARLAELPEEHVPNGLLLAQAVIVPLCKREGHTAKSQRSSPSPLLWPGSSGGSVTPQLGC